MALWFEGSGGSWLSRYVDLGPGSDTMVLQDRHSGV